MRLRISLVERLEHRHLLSVVPPVLQNVQVFFRQPPAQSVTKVEVTWQDTNSPPNSESGYRLEWSADGITWSAANSSDWPIDSTLATRELDAGQKEYYRVRAKDGDSLSPPSETQSPIMAIDNVVQLEAEDVAAGILLKWPDDPREQWHTIKRKARGATTWTDTLLNEAPREPGPQTYLDATVGVGAAYEYRVERYIENMTPPPNPKSGFQYGYVYAGRQLPLVEDRGTVLLVVDQTKASLLQAELETLKFDLIGDGWRVRRIDVPRADVPRTAGASTAAWRAAVADVKQRTRDVYESDPLALKGIFLIGHVPVPYSGVQTAWDGHNSHGDSHEGAWPSDAYYGEFDGVWDDSTATNVTAAGKGYGFRKMRTSEKTESSTRISCPVR